MNRRLFLKSSGVYVLSQFVLPSMLTRALAAATNGGPAGSAQDKVLVVLFQRGAVDGLSMVPPLGDSHYGKGIRPTIALSSSGDDAALPLDGYFGLHPALAPLLPYWTGGRLAIIHQAGSPDTTRSHFDAQDIMEAGTPGVRSTDDGFLNRALLAMPVGPKGPTLRGVALQPNLPRLFAGSSGAFAMSSLREFSTVGALARSGVGGGFESLYDSAMDEALRGAGQETFRALKTLSALPPTSAAATYPKSPLGQRLSEIARLIRGDVGVRIAVTDCGGWDTHVNQGAAKGGLARQLENFATAVAAFATDLGPRLDDVCLVTMTEFGRTVHENGTGGTDHGHGSVILTMGGGVRGKRIISHWKSLAVENLFEGRDLPVTTDFRDVWREVLSQHLGLTKLDTVFPNYASTARLGLFRA